MLDTESVACSAYSLDIAKDWHMDQQIKLLLLSKSDTILKDLVLIFHVGLGISDNCTISESNHLTCMLLLFWFVSSAGIDETF